MSKKIFSAVFVLFYMFSFFATPVYASSDVDVEESDVAEDVLQTGEDVFDTAVNATVPLGNDCLCGREYYTENIGEHSKYDCIKCGKNMYACTCNCWCGALSKLDTSGQHGSALLRLCDGCDKPCAQCDCRDDKAEILYAEKLRINGEVSPLNIPRPENGLNLSIALITILLISVGLFYLPYAPFLKNNGIEAEDVDLDSLFFKPEAQNIVAKPEKIYETPSEVEPQSRKISVKNENTKLSGISVYEKINLPWITSDNRIINVNSAVASIIMNDSNVLSGGSVSVNELTEHFMSSASVDFDRVARFPEFFGSAVEEVSEESKEGEV